MTHDALGPAFRRIGRAAGAGDARPDAELVAAFVRTRCDATFAELVARHGPMVFGTCRRTLGDGPDADDAFQATFLVLARKAASIRPPGAVGAWLYGVAWKVATKAKGLAAKRDARDRRAAKPEAVADPMTDPTLRPLLDAELARIPDSLRTVVVLCDLGGKSRSEAAKELGWPEGTVATRLAKGRAVLAERLARRGVTLSVAGLAAAMAPNRSSAAIPSTLFESTLTATAAGTGLTPAAIALANGATRAMMLSKLISAVAVLYAGIVVTTGAAMIAGSAKSNPDPTSPVVVAGGFIAAPPPKEEAPTGWTEQPAITTTGWLPGSVAYAPDGKTLVVGGTSGFVRAFDATNRKEVWTYQIKATATRTAVACSLDGKTVAATFKHGVELIDAMSGQEIDSINEPESNPSAVGYFPDRPVAGVNEMSRGLVFGDARGYWVKTWLKLPNVGTIQTSTTPNGKGPADPYAVPLAVDPKGNHAVMTGPIDPKTGKNVLWAYACGSGQGNHLLEGHKATVVCAAWSADGKTIITGDADGVIIVWDATTWKEHRRRGFDRRVCAVAVTADGGKIAVAILANNQINGAGEPAYYEQVYVVNGLGFLPAGKENEKATSGENPFAVTFGNPQYLRPKPLPVKDDKPLGGPFKGIAGLAFSPDGTELAAAFCNFTHTSRSGRLIGLVHTWKFTDQDPQPNPTATWKETVLTGDHAKSASSVTVSPDGTTVVTGGFDHHVATWNSASAKLRFYFPIKLSEGDGLTVAYRPDGKLIAVATRTGNVELFDPLKGNDTRLEGQASWAGGATTLAFSPDGTRLAAMGGRVLRIIDTTKRGVEAVRPGDEIPPVPTRPILTDLTWSADGRYFHDLRRVTKGDTWNFTIRGADGEPKSMLHDTTNAITCVASAPDLNSLAQGKADGTVVIAGGINPAPNNVIPAPVAKSAVRAVRFTPDSKKLAVVYDATDEKGNPVASSVRVYDMTVPGPRQFPDLGGATLKDRLVYDFSVSDDGKTIAVVSIDPADLNLSKTKATDVSVWRKP